MDQWLPIELRSLLCKFLDGDALQLAIATLEAFKRYNHPEHDIWRELYHRDYSTVPLVGANYQHHYFASYHQLKAESLIHDPTNYGVGLADWGYDAALQHLYREDLSVNWEQVTLRAVQRGHVDIIKLAQKLWLTTPTSWGLIILACTALVEEKPDMSEYLVKWHTDKYPEHAEDMKIMMRLTQLGVLANPPAVFRPLQV